MNERALVDRYDGFLIDLDGVMYVGDEPVEGAAEAIDRLRARGTPIRFVTNTSTKTRETVGRKLGRVGVDADVDEILTAAWATGQYLRSAGLTNVAVVGTDGLQEELARADLHVTDVGAYGRERDDPAGDDVDAVVVGRDTSVTYDDVEAAVHLVHAHGAAFVAVNVDAAVPVADGIVPGTGAFARAIETASGTPPTVVGKPEPRLFELARDALGVEDVAMVGDNPRTDVRGANGAGIASVLATRYAGGHASADGDAPASDEPTWEIEDLRGLFDAPA